MWVAIASISGGDKAVIRLQAKFLQPAANAGHAVGTDAGFDDRRYERGELRRGPAGFLEQLGMHEVEPVERMLGVFDPPVHVHPATLAGIALDGGARIDDGEFVAVLGHRQVGARHHGDDGECRAGRLPALRAAAGMVVGDLPLDRDFHRRLRASAHQRAAGEIRGGGLMP